MRKIDWYILKKFLLTFFFCLVLFTAVAVVIDSSEKLDNLLASGFTVRQVFTKYFIGFIPYIWGLLFPLFAFISVIFFTSRMATRSEIIAILASGTSYKRMLRPYFTGGLLLAGALWLGDRYWIPRANAIRGDFQSRYIDNRDPTKNRYFGNCFGCFYFRIDSNSFVAIKQYDPVAKIAQGFFLQRIHEGRVIYNLRATSFRWDSAAHKWQLQNVVERKIDSMGERLSQFARYTLDVNLEPSDLKKDEYLKDRLTTPALTHLIRQNEMRGTEGLAALKVERFRRTATPCTVLLLTMIGAIIASRKTRGGSGIHLAMGILIAAVFILSDRFSTVFATKGNFPPILAAWFPNLIFAALAWWIYRRTPK
ncbi:MAG TPA: LptF/LptG family permease [Chitinophagaceae bacterium]|nr:LptF/LptG family permease [Chitinophagaceae bacterium]